jgi:hypothetical protein
MRRGFSIGRARRRVPGLTASMAPFVLLMGCTGPPSAPSAPAVHVPVASADPRGPASLVIEGLSVSLRVAPSDAFLNYRVRFLLRETSGNSGATIQRVVVTSADETNDNGPWCWGDAPIRIQPGSTLDVFQTEAGVKVLGDYCAPYAHASGESIPLSVLVTFRDDGGREESVRTSAIIAK